MSWFWLATFVGSLAGCVYIYFGYPLLILALSRLRRRPVRSAPIEPAVSVIVAAFNEEATIVAKIENTENLDYPRGQLQMIVASDGSTDRTVDVARGAARSWVKVLDLPRAGKLAALNQAVALAEGDILLLTDANTVIQADALRRLVENFADEEVGGVCGNQEYRATGHGESAAEGEGVYWRFDKWLKLQESHLGSCYAADGAIYAIRRSLFVPLEDLAQVDDIAISTRVVLQGRRLIYDPRATAYEPAPTNNEDEFRRKVRVTNQSLRALLGLGSKLWLSGFYSFELLSHKFFRHLVPLLFLIPMLVSNIALAIGSRFFAGVLAAHLAFYALAFVAHLLRSSKLGRMRILSIPYFFVFANAAAMVGILTMLRGQSPQMWSPRGGLE